MFLPRPGEHRVLKKRRRLNASRRGNLKKKT